jgi:hypothetical protein
LALFGTLNIDNALSNPKTSHFSFLQQGTAFQLDADILDESRLSYRDPKAALPVDTPIAADDILSIRSAGADASGQHLFRLVWFDQHSNEAEVGQFYLNGCLQVQDRQTGDPYVFSFGGGCPAAGLLSDQTKVITELQLLIAPTLGAARFRKSL